MSEDVSQNNSKSFSNFGATLTSLADKKFEKVHWPEYRKVLMRIIQSQVFETAVGMFILLNLVLFVYETDLSAGTNPDEIPGWLPALNVFLFVVYAMETAIRLVAMQRHFFDGIINWNTFDLTLVLVDFVLIGLKIFNVDLGQSAFVRVLRICRSLRIVKALRTWRALRELYVMLHSLIGTMRAMLWAAIMLILVLTLFSCAAVEFINPIVLDMAANNDFTECERCSRAFSSVWNSQITFFQTVVAGDSWGQVAIPIIEKVPATAPFFVVVLVVIQLGILNLILAAIVDQASAAHEDDVQLQAINKKEAFTKARGTLLNVCRQIDTDGSGNITIEELYRGYETLPELAYQLKFLDVTRDDLGILFSALDSDYSGTVEYEEFIEQLFKLQNQDISVCLGFLKSYIQQICREVRAHSDQFEMQQQSYSEILNILKGTQEVSPAASAVQVQPVKQTQAKTATFNCTETPAFIHSELHSVQQSLDTALAVRFQALEESISAMLRIQEIRFQAFESNFNDMGTPAQAKPFKNSQLPSIIDSSSCVAPVRGSADASLGNQRRQDQISSNKVLAAQNRGPSSVLTSRV